jgi:hypothetical protein
MLTILVVWLGIITGVALQYLMVCTNKHRIHDGRTDLIKDVMEVFMLLWNGRSKELVWIEKIQLDGRNKPNTL